MTTTGERKNTIKNKTLNTFNFNNIPHIRFHPPKMYPNKNSNYIVISLFSKSKTDKQDCNHYG